MEDLVGLGGVEMEVEVEEEGGPMADLKRAIASSKEESSTVW